MHNARIVLIALVATVLLPAWVQADTLLITNPVSYTWTGGFTYNSTHYASEGAGNIQTAVLDGELVPYMYCVDIAHWIWVPGTYEADVNDYGYIYNNTLPSSGAEVTGGNLTNAGNIGYLVATQSESAEGTSEAALQAAIWKQVYGDNFNYDMSNADYSQYTTYLDLLSDSTNTSFWASQVLWINPQKNGYYAQAQVGYRPHDIHHTPLPASLALLLAGTPGFLGMGWFVRRKTQPGRSA